MSIHVLRIPKAASSALVNALGAFAEVPNTHLFTLEDVPKGDVAFAVLRDPRDRFRSAFDMYYYNWPKLSLQQRYGTDAPKALDQFVDRGPDEWMKDRYGSAFWPSTHWLRSAEYVRERGAIVIPYDRMKDCLEVMGFHYPDRTNAAPRRSDMGWEQHRQVIEAYTNDYDMMEELFMARKRTNCYPPCPIERGCADLTTVEAWAGAYTPGILPNLSTLKSLVSDAKVVVDSGTRDSSTAWAILDVMAEDGTLVSVDDLSATGRVHIAERVKRDRRFTFTKGNILEVELPEKVDVFFRDSADDAGVILGEFERAHDLGAWRIISHDWVEHASVVEAVNGFVAAHDEWAIEGSEDAGFGMVWLRRS